jgi:DNA-binding NtrC family response regulator
MMPTAAAKPATNRPATEWPVALFVDDEQQLLDGLRDAFRKKPLRLLTCTSGEAALELLARERVDVVVSDELMPGLKGAELLAQVRRRWPNVLRILFTGHASLDAAISAINEGEVYRFVTKPCAPLDLFLTIQQGLLLRDLAWQSARLAEKARRQGVLLENLEGRHPGITRVETDRRGAIVIEERDLVSLIDELAQLNLPTPGDGAPEGGE